MNVFQLGNCEDLKDLFEFVDEKSVRFECCKCRRLVLEPVSANCCHHFCRVCAFNLCGSPNDVAFCPACNRRFTGKDLSIDELVKMQITSLQVCCPNNQFGCDITTTIGLIEKHLSICKFATVLCPQGCRMPVKKSDLEEHLQFVCSNRTVSCKSCQAPVIVNNMKAHFEECPMKPVKCPFCENVDLPRPQLDLHMKTCNYRLKQCKFSEFGCRFEAKDLFEHESDMRIHVPYLFEYILKQKATFEFSMAEMKAELEEVKNENRMLKGEAENTNETMTMLKEHVNVMSRKLGSVQKYLKLTKHIENSSVKLIENAELPSNNAVMLVQQQKLAELETLVQNTADNLKEEMSFKAKNRKLNKAQEIQLNKNEHRLSSLREKIRNISQTSHNGVFIWKLENFSKLQEDALTKRGSSLYSTPFYTDQYGYKVCLNLHPIGDDTVRGIDLSLFIVVMKSHMDEILPWPFRYKATLILLDQETGKTDYEKSFTSNPKSPSSQKPNNERNQGFGFTKFFDLEKLHNSPYLVDDTVFIKAVVEVTK